MGGPLPSFVDYTSIHPTKGQRDKGAAYLCYAYAEMADPAGPPARFSPCYRRAA